MLFKNTKITIKRAWKTSNEPSDIKVQATGSSSSEEYGDSFGDDNYEKNLQDETDMAPPPDGGLIAWLQVVACWILNMNSWGIVNMFGVYQEYYESSFLSERSPGDISWIGALTLSIAFFGTFIFAYPMDLGYMRILVISASLLQFLALMLLASFCRSFSSIILVHGMFIGVNSSIFYIVSLGCVAPYFSKKRPLAMSIGTSGAAIGAVIYSCMARKLIDSVGFTWATRATAFVELGSSLIMCVIIRQRSIPTKRAGFIAFECFREVKFMLFSFANLFAFAGLITFYFHFESYALSKHPGRTEMYYTTAIVNAGSTVGRVVFGLISGLYGKANVLVVTLICSTILAWCWIPAQSEGAIISLGILFGCTTGPTMSLPGPMVASLTDDFSRLGIRMAVLFLFEGVGVIIGPSFAGMMELNDGWFWAKLYCALLMTTSALALLSCRQLLARNDLFAIV